MKIIKRNGQEAIFDEVKITNAIIGANKEVVETERLSEEEIDNITNDIKYKCQKMKRALSVEEIQQHNYFVVDPKPPFLSSVTSSSSTIPNSKKIP